MLIFTTCHLLILSCKPQTLSILLLTNAFCNFHQNWWYVSYFSRLFKVQNILCWLGNSLGHGLHLVACFCLNWKSKIKALRCNIRSMPAIKKSYILSTVRAISCCTLKSIVQNKKYFFGFKNKLCPFLRLRRIRNDQNNESNFGRPGSLCTVAAILFSTHLWPRHLWPRKSWDLIAYSEV